MTRKITINAPDKCQVGGEPATKILTTSTCDEHFDTSYEGLKQSILAARRKISEIEDIVQEPKEEKPESPPLENPVPPTADDYGIDFLYPSGNNDIQMIYMDMNNPSKDPLFRNEEGEGLVKGKFGGWRSQGGSNGQLRVELWQDNPIRDCEGTVYSKWLQDVDTGRAGAYLFQVYRGGGSHSSRYHQGQEGAALKGRIREDLSVVICKEVRHSDYTSNEGNIRKLKKDPKKNFLGVKLVVYNLKPPSRGWRVPVKIEVWCDEDGMDQNGKFDPKRQNWQKYAEYTDKGGWGSGDGGGNPGIEIGNTGTRKGDEILNTPRGAVRNKGNLFAYRTDHVLTEFKYLSWRKIKNPVGAV